MHKTRIELSDTTMGMIMKMAGGNPGAMTVIVQLLEKGEAIDPDAAFGGLAQVLALDTHGIYEEKIWMFYKDICNQDVGMMIGLLRGIQLGIMPERELKDALNQNYARMASDRVAEVLNAVRDRLPNFKG
jgi:hypothetical protein